MTMAEYPSHGTRDWDDELKAYIDEGIGLLPDGLIAPDLINTYPWSYPYTVFDATRERIYVTGIGRDGQVGLVQYDLRSKQVTRYNYAGVTPDDHNVPAILLDETAKALLVYTLHGEDDNLYVVNGSRPHALDPAISTRSTVAKATTSLGVTNYGQLIRRSSTAVVGMFRADLPSAGWHLVSSANNGVTWGASKRIHAKQYQLIRPNAAGTGFHMLIFDHTTQQTPMTCKYVFLNTATGALTGKNGAAVGNLWSDVDDPILSEAELATNGLVRSVSKSSGTSFRVHDISADGNYVLTTEFACATTPTNSVYEPDPATGQYVVLAWNGSSWARQPVVASGLPFGYYQSMYVAGGQFADNGATLYLGRESGGTWTVEKWTRSGSTWSLAKTLDSSTAYKVGRIQFPVGTEAYLTYGRYYAYNQGVGGFHTYMADQVVLPLT